MTAHDPAAPGAARRYRERVYASYFTTTYSKVNAPDDAGYAMQARALRSVLGPWLPAARDARIADLACGIGYAVAMLRGAGYANVEGVDLSAEQVAVARARNLPVVEGDALAFLAGGGGGYDLLLALDVIEHLDRDELFALLDRCREALRPGGRLIVKTANANSPIAARLRWGDLTHEQLFTEHSLRAAFLTCGLRPVHLGGQDLRPFTALGWARRLVARAGQALWRVYLVAELGREGVDVPLDFDLLGVAERA